MITVDEIMSVELRTLSEESTLADAQKIMSDAHIHHIPITNGNNTLAGLVSHRDVLAATESQLSDATLAQNARDIPVSEFMTRDVATVDPRANLRQAAIYLQKHKYGCLPVIDGGALVGIVTDSDFVSVAINLLEQIEEFEPTEE
ncbi:MAG: CBS domain-containing protein [Gammaproteobacteria bacterium]|nr:CBS domain-containing protein [Gammaproteobacteria bacterium]NND36186.1 CBS domain-containing protein [Gammaproteobacteria bacterium]